MIHITTKDGKIVQVTRETVWTQYCQLYFGDQQVYDGDMEMRVEVPLTPQQAVVAVEQQELQSLRIERGSFKS